MNRTWFKFIDVSLSYINLFSSLLPWASWIKKYIYLNFLKFFVIIIKFDIIIQILKLSTWVFI
jgi:hypothetical protein